MIHRVNLGPRPYLTADEEAKLCAHLLQASEVVLGSDVLALVSTYAEKKGILPHKGSVLSSGWWENFLKRNLMLSLQPVCEWMP